METMDGLDIPTETLTVASYWRTALADLQDRLGPRFARPEVRQRATRYLAGLLGRVERKNGWQLAEHLGEQGPQGVQRRLNGARWDAEAVRDDLRDYVIAHLGVAEGILILDETGFVKKGRHSCGVASQYTGTTGDVRNAQVGVFLAYASRHGAAFIDRALFLPRAWTADAARRAATGVPSSVRFATKLSWPSACWSGRSRRRCQRGGWWAIASMVARMPSAAG
jgi:SRSO17 transposase